MPERSICRDGLEEGRKYHSEAPPALLSVLPSRRAAMLSNRPEPVGRRYPKLRHSALSIGRTGYGGFGRTPPLLLAGGNGGFVPGLVILTQGHHSLKINKLPIGYWEGLSSAGTAGMGALLLGGSHKLWILRGPSIRRTGHPRDDQTQAFARSIDGAETGHSPSRQIKTRRPVAREHRQSRAQISSMICSGV